MRLRSSMRKYIHCHEYNINKYTIWMIVIVSLFFTKQFILFEVFSFVVHFSNWIFSYFSCDAFSFFENANFIFILVGAQLNWAFRNDNKMKEENPVKANWRNVNRSIIINVFAFHYEIIEFKRVFQWITTPNKKEEKKSNQFVCKLKNSIILYYHRRKKR